jgi:hypothetical protein
MTDQEVVRPIAAAPSLKLQALGIGLVILSTVAIAVVPSLASLAVEQRLRVSKVSAHDQARNPPQIGPSRGIQYPRAGSAILMRDCPSRSRL